MRFGHNTLNIENYLSWVCKSSAVTLDFRAIVKHGSDDGRITAYYLAVLFAPCLTQYVIDQQVILFCTTIYNSST